MKKVLFVVAAVAVAVLFVAVGMNVWFMATDAFNAAIRGDWRWATFSAAITAILVLAMTAGPLGIYWFLKRG